MKNPQVTVLLPVYNGERHLKQAIESILAQTYTDFEFLIINDGSTDRSEEIILSFNDKRINYIKNTENIRLIASLNKGLELAKGEYIARMDADDIASPDRLAQQVEYMVEHRDVVLVGSDVEVINEDGTSRYFYPNILSGATIHAALAVRNPFTHSAVMFKKQAVVELGGYSSDDYMAEDLGLWMRLAQQFGAGALANLPFVLMKYRLSVQGEMASHAGDSLRKREQLHRAYWEQMGNDPVPWQKRHAVFNRVDITREPKRLRRRTYGGLHLDLAHAYWKRTHNPFRYIYHLLNGIWYML